ncbi:hypothetical protein ACM1RC_12515 [Paenibacillus azoreducens]
MNTKRSLILLLSLCFISSLVLSACETYSASMNENASSSKQAKREK